MHIDPIERLLLILEKNKANTKPNVQPAPPMCTNIFRYCREYTCEESFKNMVSACISIIEEPCIPTNQLN